MGNCKEDLKADLSVFLPCSRCILVVCKPLSASMTVLETLRLIRRPGLDLASENASRRAVPTVPVASCLDLLEAQRTLSSTATRTTRPRQYRPLAVHEPALQKRQQPGIKKYDSFVLKPSSSWCLCYAETCFLESPCLACLAKGISPRTFITFVRKACAWPQSKHEQPTNRT